MQKQAAPYMCYHGEFSHLTVLKGVFINTGKTQKIGEPWNSALLGWEAWLTPRYTPLPHMLARHVW